MTAFSALPVEPSLAAALTSRGYHTATPVQAAVLEGTLAGRDLLVSSQTGSGKTVAFGALIADSLLRGAVAPSPRPRALVVAPTRELAVQVGRELVWLFASSGTRLGSFTGGTAVGPDLRRLRSGIDIAIGTPGRLVDLHERKALDLSDLGVLVLDEADEMLDLGFKDNLEYLLGNAPATRRTLLFSATLPREIERMASTYQRDAVRVDPRAGKPAHGHTDIRYVAHLVRPQDRLAVIVNVLLAAGDAKAIVFVRTRGAVGELHQRLTDHGFSAAAIAGDRAQGERDRALEALRDGRARILVATNVAARGLDLPDVDLVVHADLPENADALTHRSGRTGRAGKKGTSVVIATPAERRKAERLLASARPPVGWTPAPAADDVRKQVHDRLAASLLAIAAGTAAPGPPRPDDGISTLVDRLGASMPPRALLALLLRREVDRLPPPLAVEPVDPSFRPDARRMGVRERANTRPPPAHGKPGDSPRPRAWTRAVIFRINMGAETGAEPRWLLPLICRRGGITRREIGAIRVGPRSSTFEIAEQAAGEFALAAAEPDPRAPHVRIEPAHARPGHM